MGDAELQVWVASRWYCCALLFEDTNANITVDVWIGIFIRKDKSDITDGSDINCVDASRDRKLIVTGDDEGNVRLFRFPANQKVRISLHHSFIFFVHFFLPLLSSNFSQNDFLAFGGHSSHVMRTIFSRDGKRVFSAGGNDKCVMQWLVDVLPTDI